MVLFLQTGLNETYLNTLETEGKITKLFNDAYSKLSPETRADIAHSAEGEQDHCMIVQIKFIASSFLRHDQELQI